MATRIAMIFMACSCLISNQSLGGQNETVSDVGEQPSRGVTIIQASLLGGGFALIASSAIFDRQEISTETYWVEDGTGGSINVPTQVGADTGAMFWTGAVFVALAAIIELFPQESGSSINYLSLNPIGGAGGLRVETTNLDGGATAVGVASTF